MEDQRRGSLMHSSLQRWQTCVRSTGAFEGSMLMDSESSGRLSRKIAARISLGMQFIWTNRSSSRDGY